MALRLSVYKSLQKAKALESNVLPLNLDVVGHYLYLRKKLSNTNPKFLKNLLRFKEIKDQPLSDIASVWKKASLLILNTQGIVVKMKDVIEKYNAARKEELKRG